MKPIKERAIIVIFKVTGLKAAMRY